MNMLGKAARSDSMQYPRSGFRLGDKGIYLCTRKLKDRNGNRIGKFNFFAASEDMNVRDSSGKKTLLTFKDTAIELGKRNGWLGHEGCKLDFEHYEEQLMKGLKDRSAVGKWFVPTKELVHGEDIDGNKVWPENLYDLRETGDLKATSTTVSGSVNEDWYWSCTECPDYPNYVLIVRFSNYRDNWNHKDTNRLSCRPCRVELAL